MTGRQQQRMQAMDELREKWNTRTHALSELADERLAAALSIKDPALARRLAGTRRLQRRIHGLAQTQGKSSQASNASAPMTSPSPEILAASQHQDAPTETDPLVTALLEADRLSLAVRFATLAIQMRSLGSMIGKEEYQELVEAHGKEAVAFAFTNRSSAPEPSSEDTPESNKFRWGASCIATWAASKRLNGAEKLMPGLVEFEPVPYGTPAAHKAASILGEKAINAVLALPGPANEAPEAQP